MRRPDLCVLCGTDIREHRRNRGGRATCPSGRLGTRQGAEVPGTETARPSGAGAGARVMEPTYGGEPSARTPGQSQPRPSRPVASPYAEPSPPTELGPHAGWVEVASIRLPCKLDLLATVVGALTLDQAERGNALTAYERDGVLRLGYWMVA